MTRNGTNDSEFSELERSRLRSALGIIGEAQPTPYTAAVPGTPTRSRSRGLPLIAAGALLAFGIGVWRLSPDETKKVSPADPSTASSQSPVTTAASTTTPEDPAPPEGPWYTLNDDPGTAQDVVPSSTDYSSVVFVGSDAAPNPAVLVARVLSKSSAQTSLIGVDSHRIQPVDGVLELIASSDDEPDPETPSLVGNEMRWTMSSGVVVEFASVGVSPSVLVKDVLDLGPQVEAGCPCRVPGFDSWSTKDSPSAAARTFVTDGGAGELLRRSGPDALNDFFADLAQRGSVELIAGPSGPALSAGESVAWLSRGYLFVFSAPRRPDSAVAGLEESGDSGSNVDTSPSEWRVLPAPPTAPKRNSHVIDLGDGSALVLGGEVLDCTAQPDCRTGHGDADGAILVEATLEWHATSAAPVALLDPSTAVIGRTVFVSEETPEGRVMLTYSLDGDTWSRISNAPADVGGRLVASEDRVLAYPRQGDPGSDWIYDPAIDAWTEGQPEPASFDVIVDVGTRMRGLATTPSGGLAVYSYSFGDMAWVETASLTQSVQHVYGLREDGLVAIASSSVFTLRPEAATWEQISDSASSALAGALGGNSADYSASHGDLIDTVTRSTTQIPQFDDRNEAGLGAVGRALVVVGGLANSSTGDRPVDNALVWIPAS